MTDSKGGNGRDERGRFLPGHNMPGPGNPHVRHLSALQKELRAAVTPEQLREVVARLHEQALDGDVQAARLLLERVLGKPREEPRTIEIELPQLDSTEGIAQALRIVATATASGEVSTEDAARLVAMLRQVGDLTVLATLEQRVADIEHEREGLHPSHRIEP